jgi:GNAT superfamily N-acetyltransferase
LISNLALLQNEAGFDSLFCEVIRRDAYSIYYNTHFWEDPIFNHSTFSPAILEADSYSSLETDEVVTQIIEETRKAQVPSSIYLDRFWRNSKNLERDAIDSGFLIIEQMHILKKSTGSSPLDKVPGIKAGATGDILAWNRAFIESFGIPDTWLAELERRLRLLANDPQTILLAATEEGIPQVSGCSLLHVNPPKCLGVYCVGTLPERRGHGIAKALMGVAESEAKRRSCEVIVLQTIASDGVAPMYLKMGYENAFERDVLQLRE